MTIYICKTFVIFECLSFLLETKPRYRAKSPNSLQNFHDKIFLIGIVPHASKSSTEKANVGVLL